MKTVKSFARWLALTDIFRVGAALVGSPTARGLTRMAVTDPTGFARTVADPRTIRVLGSRAMRDPAAGSAARVGLLFVPLRYLFLGQAAMWGLRRLVGRSTLDRAGLAADPAPSQAVVVLVDDQAGNVPISGTRA